MTMFRCAFGSFCQPSNARTATATFRAVGSRRCLPFTCHLITQDEMMTPRDGYLIHPDIYVLWIKSTTRSESSFQRHRHLKHSKLPFFSSNLLALFCSGG